MNMRHLTIVVAIVLCALPAFAQTTPAQATAPMQETMNCEAMMKQMHEQMKTMDDRLQQLVDEMNKARGSARVDKTAAVVNELVTQRAQMRSHMMGMMPRMMNHMMEHMQSGMMKGAAKEMKACPMMGQSEATPQHH